MQEVPLQHIQLIRLNPSPADPVLPYGRARRRCQISHPHHVRVDLFGKFKASFDNFLVIIIKPDHDIPHNSNIITPQDVYRLVNLLHRDTFVELPQFVVTCHLDAEDRHKHPGLFHQRDVPLQPYPVAGTTQADPFHIKIPLDFLLAELPDPLGIQVKIVFLNHHHPHPVFLFQRLHLFNNPARGFSAPTLKIIKRPGIVLAPFVAKRAAVRAPPGRDDLHEGLPVRMADILFHRKQFVRR